MRSRSSALAVVALIGCRHAQTIENAAPASEGLAIAVYDRGDGTSSAVVDDRRWVALKSGEKSLVLDDIDPAAALPSLVIEASGSALHLGTCRRGLIEPPVPIAEEGTPAPKVNEPIVHCDADGPPGRYLVRVLYVTAGLGYRAQHEVRMSSPDRATLRSTYAFTTPAWHRTADVTVFDGAPGGDHPPRSIARGKVAMDGSSGAIVVPEREVRGRLRRVFDGAMTPSPDLPSSDIAWGESSHEVVWVWLELADARVPPGPVHAILDLPNELARVSDISIEARHRSPDATPDAPTRLAIYADEALKGKRQRWHDFSDPAELADRFVVTISNIGDEPREVWIEEHLRAARRRRVAHAWPKAPGQHGEILREKLMVRPGSTERIGFTVDYDF